MRMTVCVCLLLSFPMHSQTQPFEGRTQVHWPQLAKITISDRDGHILILFALIDT